MEFWELFALFMLPELFMLPDWLPVWFCEFPLELPSFMFGVVDGVEAVELVCEFMPVFWLLIVEFEFWLLEVEDEPQVFCANAATLNTRKANTVSKLIFLMDPLVIVSDRMVGPSGCSWVSLS